MVYHQQPCALDPTSGFNRQDVGFYLGRPRPHSALPLAGPRDGARETSLRRPGGRGSRRKIRGGRQLLGQAPKGHQTQSAVTPKKPPVAHRASGGARRLL